MDLAQQKIRDARLTLDLIDAKRAKLSGPRDEALSELSTQLKGHVEAWNSAIRKGIETIEAQVVETMTQFFNDDEVECRRFWSEGNMPRLLIFHEWRQAFYPTDCLRQRMERDLVGTAKDFLRSVERHSAVLKLDLSILN
ncbi:MAG: hypothetical protein ACLPRE_11390 [Limisphaerales bacterium]